MLVIITRIVGVGLFALGFVLLLYGVWIAYHYQVHVKRRYSAYRTTTKALMARRYVLDFLARHNCHLDETPKYCTAFLFVGMFLMIGGGRYIL